MSFTVKCAVWWFPSTARAGPVACDIVCCGTQMQAKKWKFTVRLTHLFLPHPSWKHRREGSFWKGGIMEFDEILKVLAPCGLNCGKCMAFKDGRDNEECKGA